MTSAPSKKRSNKFISIQRIIPLIPRKTKSANTVSLTLQNTIDYKNVVLLKKFISPEGKILSRRLSGLTAKQQRAMAKAIKNARMSALLPFVKTLEKGV
jgi:small subunit ribosomal protein S18